MNHLAGHFLKSETFREELKIMDALTNIHTHLVSENHAGKRYARPLPEGGFHEKIVVPGKEDPAKRTCPVQQVGIFHIRASILLSRQYIESSRRESACDGTWDMNIHVKGKAHCLEIPCKRRPSGESEAILAATLADSRLLRISVSIDKRWS